jgi:hypothetical protein
MRSPNSEVVFNKQAHALEQWKDKNIRTTTHFACRRSRIEKCIIEQISLSNEESETIESNRRTDIDANMTMPVY